MSLSVPAHTLVSLLSPCGYRTKEITSAPLASISLQFGATKCHHTDQLRPEGWQDWTGMWSTYYYKPEDGVSYPCFRVRKQGWSRSQMSPSVFRSTTTDRHSIFKNGSSKFPCVSARAHTPSNTMKGPPCELRSISLIRHICKTTSCIYFSSTGTFSIGPPLIPAVAFNKNALR